MTNLISKRGSSECRACGGGKLESVLNLGSQPLPAEYGRFADEVLHEFPLHLHICSDCGLGQLGEYVLPERIFHDEYPYLSSASSSWVRYARSFAEEMQETLNLDGDTLVVELASNDGYLLSAFQVLGVPVLGVEPANNVASIAQSAGIPTLTKFFGAQAASDMLENYAHPRLIVANNVFAHVPDMHDFMQGIAMLADDHTTVTIENPSFVALLENTFFDTIYHEHYSYLTAHVVRDIAAAHGLYLIHVDELPTHGGSNRYWLSKNDLVDETVGLVLQKELDVGLFEPNAWLAFANRANAAIDGLREWFLERKQAGHVVAGYGAAHKGNTFLNAVGEESKNLVYVVDASSEKQGRFLPGSQVPVLAPEKLNSANPTDVLILPWNITSEIAPIVRKCAPDARIWVAQPSMRQL